MKPCADQKEAIALLAAGALAASEAAALRAHLTECAGCRSYAIQLDTLCARLGDPIASSAPVMPSPGFHARLKHRIQPASKESSLTVTIAALREWLTPTRLASAAAALVVVAALVFWMRTDKESSVSPVTQRGTPSAISDDATKPDFAATATLMAYQAAFNRSFEDFDALVTQNSRRNSTPDGMPLIRGGSASF